MIGPDGRYLNFSGCGNTVNCNHPVVRQLMLNCLRFWVADMHVDGLRFDLASVMGRDMNGRVLVEPPVVEMIAEDAVLADTKLIAEPWDAVGLYQVGKFPFGRRWSEWNGKFRDEVRRFWRGEPGMTGRLATRLCGSSDLYQSSGRLPRHSINFITCHDGFTLWDLVSYNRKHNETNGEGNRDGSDENFSWNCGFEGPTDNAGILALRRRQARNLMATLMLSQGVPMLLAGDELLRTQGGNNNAWCQDNAISWVDWSLEQKNGDFLRFVRELTVLRKRHPSLRRTRFLLDNEAIWHGIEAYKPDFTATSRALAVVLDGSRTGRERDRDIYMAFNAWQGPLAFSIPPAPQGRTWRRVIDTALPSPQDIVGLDEGPEIHVGSRYTMASFSTLVLIAGA
jgi:glycogen operon protein